VPFAFPLGVHGKRPARTRASIMGGSTNFDVEINSGLYQINIGL